MTTPPRDALEVPARAGWLYSLTVGALTVCSAVFGIFLASCGGILIAMLQTVLMLGFYMLVVPKILMCVLAGVLGVALAVRLLSAIPWMSERIGLLAFLMPVIGMVLGWIYGWQMESRSACVLKT